MSMENKSKVRHPICSVRALLIFLAVILFATLLFLIIYFVVLYNNESAEVFGTLTCKITKETIGFHEDRHYMLCQIEDQIIDAPNISIASTGEDHLVNDFSIWNETEMFFLPDRIGERFPNLYTVGGGYTKVRFLQRSLFVGFTRLRNVFVTNSDLEEIEHGAFDSLDSLVVMDLSSNKIKAIDVSWFENKKLLTWISFSSNEIEFIPAGCFDSLPSLATLLMNYNKISRIESPLFLNNNLMQTLHLMSNPLVYISDTAFDGNFSQLTVELMDTPCFPMGHLIIPQYDWKIIVRERCNGTEVLE